MNSKDELKKKMKDEFKKRLENLINNSISHGDHKEFCKIIDKNRKWTILIKVGEPEILATRSNYILSNAISATHYWLYSSNFNFYFENVKSIEIKIDIDEEIVLKETILCGSNEKALILYNSNKIKNSAESKSKNQIEPPETKGLQFIFTKQVDVLLEEYKSLRKEISSSSSEKTSMFYYGLATLGITYGAIQAAILQLNNYEFISKFDINQINAVRISLMLLMSAFVPAVSFIFLLKWLSNARSVAFIAANVCRTEVMINQSFRDFKEVYPDVIKKYTLDLRWENNLREMRNASSDPNIQYGNSHIIIVVVLFLGIGFISQIYSLLTIGVDETISFGIYLITTISFLILMSILLYDLGVISEWYLALPFGENTVISNKKNDINILIKRSIFLVFYSFVVTLKLFYQLLIKILAWGRKIIPGYKNFWFELWCKVGIVILLLLQFDSNISRPSLYFLFICFYWCNIYEFFRGTKDKLDEKMNEFEQFLIRKIGRDFQGKNKYLTTQFVSIGMTIYFSFNSFFLISMSIGLMSPAYENYQFLTYRNFHGPTYGIENFAALKSDAVIRDFQEKINEILVKESTTDFRGVYCELLMSHRNSIERICEAASRVSITMKSKNKLKYIKDSSLKDINSYLEKAVKLSEECCEIL